METGQRGLIYRAFIKFYEFFFDVWSHFLFHSMTLAITILSNGLVNFLLKTVRILQ